MNKKFDEEVGSLENFYIIIITIKVLKSYEWNIIFQQQQDVDILVVSIPGFSSNPGNPEF